MVILDSGQGQVGPIPSRLNLFLANHQASVFSMLHAQGTLNEYIPPNNIFIQLCLDAMLTFLQFETFSSQECKHFSIQRPRVADTFEFYQAVSPYAQFASGCGFFSVLRTTTQSHKDGVVTSGNQAWDACRQAILNKLMHALNGNTVLRLLPMFDEIQASLQLSLSDLIPNPNIAIPSSETFKYPRSVLLQMRDPQLKDVTFNPPSLTTTPVYSSAATADPSTRTGRRITIQREDGTIFFKKRDKHCRHRFHRNSRIHRIKAGNSSRTPPPRGASGAPNGSYEECTPQVDRALDVSRGTLKRRYRRRAYRRWCRGLNKDRMKGPGPPHPALPQPKKAALTRAKWFRNAIYWQEYMRRRRVKRVIKYPTTTPLAYDSRLRFGALNVQGFADTLKLKNAIQLMQEHNLGILLLSEAKSTSYYSYTSEEHLVVLSGNKRDRHAGVGAIISPSLRPYLMDVVQVNSRIIHFSLKKQGGNIHVIGVYGPHSGLDFEEERSPFWDTLEEHISKIPQPEPVYVTGDFNVRLQASHKNDQGVTGRFTYGKGPRFIDHNATSNRSLCIGSMGRLNMVEVASYKTPSQIHHITYRDKAAPPKDWSQFLLDPLIMQQVYDKIHYTCEEFALGVAAQVRSFLELPGLLPPPKILPQADPIMFQRLDHTFTRRQWLNSVNNCRSKLHTGYPSDHYLLVTEIKVRLAAKAPKLPKPPKLQITKDPQKIRDFNAIVSELWRDPDSLDHNAAADTTGADIAVYTDGSGTAGKCSRHTPAGWGFCYEKDGEWHDASGPVTTTPDSPQYWGAQVGSNNTGEVTAIVEALLHAHQQNWSKIRIRSDSQWAINTITGKWRAKHHKPLVNFAKYLVKTGPLKVVFQWVKGHAGQEGNERADKLAETGKNSVSRTGTEASPPDPAPSRNNIPNTADVATTIQEAAQQGLSKSTRAPRRPWITNDTLEALEEARRLEAIQDPDAKHARNVAKRKARKDRIKWIHEGLEADHSHEQTNMWKMIRNQKRGFQGKKTHLIVDGKPVP